MLRGLRRAGLALKIARADASVRELHQEEMRKGHAILAQRLGTTMLRGR